LDEDRKIKTPGLASTNVSKLLKSQNPIILPLGISNVYLIRCEGGYLQVDTGYESNYRGYKKVLSLVGVKLHEIRYLFLTHHHDDHAGFLNELTSETDLTIICHEKARSLLFNGKNDKTSGGGYINGMIKILAGIKMRFDPRWTLTFPPFTLREKDILISAGDDQLLRKIGIEGRILTTPGHCVDHIAIVLDNGDAFCGDAASSFLLPFGTRYATLFMTNMEDAYRSWQKMLDARAQVIYPSHGKPFSAEKLRQNMGKYKTKDLVRFF
jgi:glyoxylase-like metal-dependent hydrolase (beta-lactamase superfamily II)